MPNKTALVTTDATFAEFLIARTGIEPRLTAFQEYRFEYDPANPDAAVEVLDKLHNAQLAYPAYLCARGILSDFLDTD